MLFRSKLYVVDDQGGDTGTLAGGWALTFTSTVAPSAPPVPPPLSLRLNAGVINLSWPANTVGFSLEGSGLGRTPVWTNVPVIPTVAGTNFTISINAVGGPQFFRLRHP